VISRVGSDKQGSEEQGLLGRVSIAACDLKGVMFRACRAGHLMGRV
jgi:hypothetical protein